jgi:tryptophan 2,3-dioxygenase
MNGQPTQVVRSSFNILTFKKDGTLVPPLSDRHVRARAELALALDQPIRDTAVADASTRFLARGGQWSPAAAVRRRIEQTALGREKCQRV